MILYSVSIIAEHNLFIVFSESDSFKSGMWSMCWFDPLVSLVTVVCACSGFLGI